MADASTNKSGFLHWLHKARIGLFLSVLDFLLNAGDRGQGLKIVFHLLGTMLDFIFANDIRLRRKGQRPACSVDDAFGSRQDQRHPFHGVVTKGVGK